MTYRTAILVAAAALIVFVGLTLSNRASTLRSAERELLARTDVLAEFFDGTLTALSLGARMLENAPDRSAMNDLALSIPLLRSVALYDMTGALVRSVPPGLHDGEGTLDPPLLSRHVDRWEETVVSSDESGQRLRVSRVIDGAADGRLQIAVLTTSVQATLSRLPETLAAPVYGAALVDISGEELFHFVRADSGRHEERYVTDDISLQTIDLQSVILDAGRADQMAAGKQLSDFPVRLILTYDTALVLEPWWRTTLLSGAIAAVLIATIFVVVRGLKQQSERRAQVEQQVQELSDDVEHATDRLETARDELSDLAYVVAHDLKAPLRGISQLAGWLREDHSSQLDESGSSMLTMLEERVGRMNNMIEAILSYSRVNRDSIVPEQVDLHELIRTTVDEIALPESVTVTCSPDLPTVSGDPVQLRRLFQNLIDNAARVVTRSQGSVSVEVDQSDTDMWAILVRDDGPGVDPKFHETIFRPLQTVEGTESESGTGMGLAICRKIANRHKGTLSVTSAVGKGTVMTVRLPREKTNEQ